MMETTVILRTLLYQALKAKSLDDVINAITVMCSEEDVALVMKQIKDSDDKKKKKTL